MEKALELGKSEHESAQEGGPGINGTGVDCTARTPFGIFVFISRLQKGN
jgi:hypothetical protein